MLSRENVGETSSPFEFRGSVDLKKKQKRKEKEMLVNMMIVMMRVMKEEKKKTKHTKITGLNFIPPVLFPFSPSPLPPRKVFTTSPG